MSTRKPVLPELTLTVEYFPWTGVTDTRERTRIELRAAEAVIRAAKRAELMRAAYVIGGGKEAHARWMTAVGREHRAFDRLDALTRPTRRTP